MDFVDEGPSKSCLEAQLKKIDFMVYPKNKLVKIKYIPPVFHLIGLGTDAVVVQHPEYLNLVFKVFSLNELYKLENEYTAYQKIGEFPFFSRCIFKGKFYLALKYEQGPTLYQCLEQGIIIPEQVILDVETAQTHAKKVGLFPRDIHLKNVILQNGRAKVIDVADYLSSKHDLRWDHLVEGYKRYYHIIQGKKIPTWILEWVKKRYVEQTSSHFSIERFAQQLLQLDKSS